MEDASPSRRSRPYRDGGDRTSPRSRTPATSSHSPTRRRCECVETPGPPSLRVVDPAQLLAIADGAEANALERLRPRPEVLGVVDPYPRRLVEDDTRGVLVGLLADLAIRGLQR